MAPFEALYGRKCLTPLFWNQAGETQVFGPDVLRNAEKQVRKIRENLRVAQSRQKSYADTRRRELTFKLGDYVYLKVSPMKGVKSFNMKEKLSPRYIGPFKILERHEEQISLEEIVVKEDLTYNEYPVKILEIAEGVTRSRTIKMCKVQ
jgi:hypothetical protein